MLAAETEMHAAFRRQKHDDRLNIHPESAQLVARIEDTIDRHLGGLRHCLAGLGGEESVVKNAIGSLLGAAAGIYNGMRTDEPISRMLRDDYIALTSAIVCYEMLHTTALAAGQDTVAELALAHMKDFAPLVMRLGEALPFAIVEELSRGGKLQSDRAAAERAAQNTRSAWTEGAPA
jgi:hypothetical protein